MKFAVQTQRLVKALALFNECDPSSVRRLASLVEASSNVEIQKLTPKAQEFSTALDVAVRELTSFQASRVDDFIPTPDWNKKTLPKSPPQSKKGGSSAKKMSKADAGAGGISPRSVMCRSNGKGTKVLQGHDATSESSVDDYEFTGVRFQNGAEKGSSDQAQDGENGTGKTEILQQGAENVLSVQENAEESPIDDDQEFTFMNLRREEPMPCSEEKRGGPYIITRTDEGYRYPHSFSITKGSHGLADWDVAPVVSMDEIEASLNFWDRVSLFFMGVWR